jgi:hypothetical protein
VSESPIGTVKVISADTDAPESQAPRQRRPERPVQPEEGLTRHLHREATPLVLLAVGVAAILAAFLARDVTWRAIWIGVASTTVSAALVDGSAILVLGNLSFIVCLGGAWRGILGFGLKNFADC